MACEMFHTWTEADLISIKHVSEIGIKIHFFPETVFEFVNLKMNSILFGPQWVNTLRPRQNGHDSADDTFKRMFINENVRISIKM